MNLGGFEDFISYASLDRCLHKVNVVCCIGLYEDRALGRYGYIPTYRDEVRKAQMCACHKGLQVVPEGD